MFGSKQSTVKFGTNEPIVVENGTSILEAALTNDIELESFCEGSCSCSTCRVEIISGGQNLSKMSPQEASLLGESRVGNGDRLSCQAKVSGPVHVQIPDIF